VRQRHSSYRLPSAIFDAVFRLLPAYRRAIDGHITAEKQVAWREITAKLRLNPELRRQLGEQAESVLAALDPTALMQRFTFLRRNARLALESKGSVNSLYQKVLQFYPNIHATDQEGDSAAGGRVCF
jgi:hypothetical protein